MSRNSRYSSNNTKSLAIGWQHALSLSQYKFLLFVGLSVLTLLLTCLPFFFHMIQERHGFTMADPILSFLPAVNLSIPIFLTIWSVISLTLLRSLQDPMKFLQVIYAVIFLCLLRYLSISLIALDPPANLIPMSDPVSNLTYGHADFITKDLFFSGHTSSMFLCFLCLHRKPERLFALLATIAIAVMVLVQHVHYTIDVVAAPLFTYLAFRLSKKLTDLGK